MTTILADYSFFTVLTLAALAFLAGFVDAVVGGGGLVQIPALLINLPEKTLPQLFGTNKIASLSGTLVAAFQYARKIKYDILLLLTLSFFAFAASNLGARSLSFIDPAVLRPVILVILILIVAYTFFRKDLGSVQGKILPYGLQLLYGSIMATIVGFYDGFFGPGTGSFFVLGFVVIFGFDFLRASAYSKVINSVTNLSALIVFLRQGNYLADVALIMAVCNIGGSFTGSRLALIRGNRFVRIVFLLVVSAMIVRYGYDIVSGK